jgi:hypothetical protein
VEVVCAVAPIFVKGTGKQRGVALVVLNLAKARQAVAWGDLEKYLPAGLEYFAVEQQPVGCYALEKHSHYPLVNKPFVLLMVPGMLRRVARLQRVMVTILRSRQVFSRSFSSSLGIGSSVQVGFHRVWACFGLKCKASCLVAGWMLNRAKAVLRKAQWI